MCALIRRAIIQHKLGVLHIRPRNRMLRFGSVVARRARRHHHCRIHSHMLPLYRRVSSTAMNAVSPIVERTLVARYAKFGQVEAVTQLVNEPVRQLGDGDVLIKMLAAPLNPADFNMIEGVYGVEPDEMPAVGGNEGAGEVIQVGPTVTSLQVGDWVIPSLPGFGTWRTHVVCNEHTVDSIRDRGTISPESLATIAVNPCSAYRMLHDFAELVPGDVVVQNGANSAVGLAVIQIAATMGVKTVNVVRNRPNLDEVVERLHGLGADMVVTPEEIKTPKIKDLIKELGDGKRRPMLGLNCVGGDSATDVARCLGQGGTMVTYGGLSRKPVQVATGTLIFKDLRLRGFWLSRWTAERSKTERMEMIGAIVQLIQGGQFTSDVEKWRFEDLSGAILRAKESYRNRKVVLEF